MIFKKKYSVIEFGTSKVALATGSAASNHSDIMGIGLCEYAGFRDNEWLAPEHLEESIYLAKKDAEFKTGKKILNVYVLVPGEFTRSFFSHLTSKPFNIDGRIAGVDIEKMIDDGKHDLPWPDDYEIIHVSPMLYLLDGMSWRKYPEGAYAKDLECFVSYTAADKVFMDNMTAMLDEVGMGVKGFVAAPKATGELIFKESDKKTVIIMDTGYFSTDILIYENGGIIIHDNIPIGGYHIASDIMVKLGLDRDRAEFVKKSCSIGMDNIGVNKVIVDEDGTRISFPTGDTQEIIEARVDEITDIMMQMIGKSGMQVSNRTVLFLTGGGIAQIKGIREYITRTTRLSTRVFTPSRPIISTPMQTGVCAGLEYVISTKGLVNNIDFYNYENNDYDFNLA